MVTNFEIEMLEEFQNNPVLHVEEIQGISTTESFQKNIMLAVARHQRVSVAACHDLGKTWTVAKIVLWFGSTFPGSKIITTAPTYNQVKRLLWSEINSGFYKSKYPLGGKMLDTEWKIDKDWFAVGFTSRNESQETVGQGTASTFQGFHAPYLLVVIDEATGVQKQIWDQAEGLLTSHFVRLIAIGNPTSKSSQFFKTFQSPGTHKIYLSCFDSPNLITNGICDMSSLLTEVSNVNCMPDAEKLERLESYKVAQPSLLTARWVIEKAIDWGIEHPLFVSKVLGRFPDEDEQVLFPLGVVESAMYRQPIKNEKSVSYGVDVARFGSDKTVITKMFGSVVKEVKALSKRTTTDITGQIVTMINGCIDSLNGSIVCVDSTGIGSGVVDALQEYRQQHREWGRVHIVEVNFGETFNSEPSYQKIEKSEKYVNKKAEMFVLLSHDLKTEIVLPNESQYLQELPTIIYRFDSKGRYKIEGKEEYKKRTGLGSPDYSDSLALANYGRHKAAMIMTKIPEVKSFKPSAPSLYSQDW